MKKKGSLNQSKGSLNQSNKARNFWLLAGLLVVLLCSIMTQFWSPSNNITRPFYGLHSWAEAHGPWNARVHLNYGLGYTKGMLTKAVGNPPTENPLRYLNHPQLPTLLNVPFMAFFGFHEWSLRVVGIMQTVITLLLFLKILRALLDDKTTLLAGLMFCLFPLIGYFGTQGWLYPFGLWAIWNYLVIIKGIRAGPKPAKLYKICLAFSLFMTLQVSWEGFFFALAIGVHYIFHCLRKYIKQRQMPDIILLAILIIAPAASLMINFTVMAAGYGWDWERILITYKWRASSGEMQQHDWGAWFARLWEFAVTNFTLPILITTIVYLTFGQLFVFMETKPNKRDKRRPRQFPQFWLFFMIPVFQQFLLKGCLWKHQTWEKPFCFLVAIAAAQGVMLLVDILKKANKYLANVAMILLIGVICTYCAIGTNYYYGIRWQAPTKIEMFKNLNKSIPPDKFLLSFESFVVDQGNKAKIPFYRPEIAWYLDREIVQAGIVKNRRLMVAESLKDIEQKARTGKYPYYLIPKLKPLMPLIIQLAQRYQVYKQIPGEPGESKDGKFYRAGMMPYFIFDLHSKAPGS